MMWSDPIVDSEDLLSRLRTLPYTEYCLRLNLIQELIMEMMIDELNEVGKIVLGENTTLQ